jgi:hypothetical protein
MEEPESDAQAGELLMRKFSHGWGKVPEKAQKELTTGAI